jgi:hypothetical protein
MGVVILLAAFSATGIAMGLGVLALPGHHPSRWRFVLTMTGINLPILLLSLCIGFVHIRRRSPDRTERAVRTRGLYIATGVFVLATIGEFWFQIAGRLPSWLHSTFMSLGALSLIHFSREIYRVMSTRK